MLSSPLWAEIDLKSELALYAGLKVISDRNCTKSIPWFELRTWKERLFSRPWKPFERLKVVHREIPDSHIYIMGNTIIAHPAVVGRIREAIPEP